MTGKVSIVLLTFNQLEYNRMCLDSILEHTQDTPYELVIVDNASSDGTREYLQEFAAAHPGVRLILNPTNEGFARGNNIGAQAAAGEYLVFLNNDTIVTGGWLSRLIAHLQDPMVGMVGPVTNTSGNETRIRVGYHNLSQMPAFARQYTSEHAGQAFEIRMLPLLCAAMRRLVWEQVGPLDESFGVGMFEDDDYAMRLKQAGYRILCAEDVFIHHWGSAGFKRLGFAEYWQIFRENRQKFEDKWETEWIPTRYRDDLLDEQLYGITGEKTDLAFGIIERDRKIALLQAELDDIHISKGWSFIIAFRKLAARVAPKGTVREKFGMAFFRLLLSVLKAFRSVYRWIINGRDGLRGTLVKRRYRKALEAILSEHPDRRETFLFTPTLEWGINLFQRPHQLAKALADRGCLVFYSEPVGVETYPKGFHKIQDRLYIANLGLDVFQYVPDLAAFTLVYNTHFLKHVPGARVIYDYIDELDVFPGNLQEHMRIHDQMVNSADLVIATADKLYHDVAGQRPDALLCPNGVDYNFIRGGMQDTVQPPEDIADLVASGKPIIGYYGALARWFDYALVDWAARSRPDYHFLLIGPDYDGTFPKTRLSRRKNARWLGPRPYMQIPHYLKYFTVATIPFQLNEITHATSPLKLFEYFAGRKPSVTTAMRECKKYPQVLIAEDREDFICKLDEAVQKQDDPLYLDQLERAAQENTWEQRAEAILKALSAKKA